MLVVDYKADRLLKRSGQIDGTLCSRPFKVEFNRCLREIVTQTRPGIPPTLRSAAACARREETPEVVCRRTGRSIYLTKPPGLSVTIRQEAEIWNDITSKWVRLRGSETSTQ